MKLNSKQTTQRKAGMTLLELTVVILVLLSLISILFVGARAWKKGSDKAANIMNLRNCQQAMRGHQNMNNLLVGATFDQAMLEEYIKFPTEPNSDITYTAGDSITDSEVLDGSNVWLDAGPNGNPADPAADYGPTLEEVLGW